MKNILGTLYMSILSRLLTAVLFGTALVFLCIAPYTKVEESFNIQAIHDIIVYGVDDLSKYDHQQFPGPVKRTFVGALMLGVPLQFLPASILVRFEGLVSLLASPSFSDAYSITWVNYQFLARLILGVFNCLAINRVKNKVSESCDRQSKTVGLWFGLLQFVQFHFLFYCSRTLPNFLALPLVNIALGSFVNGDIIRSLGFLFAIGIIFRIEIVVFAGTLALVALYRKQISPKNMAIYTSFGLFAGAMISYRCDSHFWGTKTLPEWDSFVYNVIDGNATNWGTEPVYAYFTKYLPRIFMIPVVPILAIPGFKLDLVNFKVGTMQTISIASLLYICVMSLQPHKEWRFIVYALPGLTMSAASEIAYLTDKYSKPIYKVVIIALSLGNYALALFSGYASSFNYPGGQALTDLNLKVFQENSGGLFTPMTIHTDVASCMSGVTLFNEIRNVNDTFNIVYDKTEDSTLADKWSSFDYVISEEDDLTVPSKPGCKWIKVDVVTGLHGIDKSAIVHTVTEPSKLFNAVRYSVERRTLRYVNDLVAGTLRLDPSIFVYEQFCGNDVEF